jgi:hypothetical protein
MIPKEMRSKANIRRKWYMSVEAITKTSVKAESLKEN